MGKVRRTTRVQGSQSAAVITTGGWRACPRWASRKMRFRSWFAQAKKSSPLPPRAAAAATRSFPPRCKA